MPEKGTACPMCGYVLRKWAVSCPKCRMRLGDNVDERLAELARKYLKKINP